MIFIKSIKNNYSWQGLLIVSLLGIIGILILIFTNFFNITNYNDFFDYILAYGIESCFSFFFIGMFIYCWYSFFKTLFVKSKQETLYLLSTENGYNKYINNKGKTFLFSNNQEQAGKYYYVLKTSNDIVEVIGESLEIFEIPNEKRSYWLNFYSPIGNFEDLLLLPIVYVILLPGILSFFYINWL